MKIYRTQGGILIFSIPMRQFHMVLFKYNLDKNKTVHFLYIERKKKKDIE